MRKHSSDPPIARQNFSPVAFFWAWVIKQIIIDQVQLHLGLSLPRSFVMIYDHVTSQDMNPDHVRDKILAAMPDAEVEVVSHDNVHYRAEVRYQGFHGQSKVAQHRMVYQALGDSMQQAIHALELITLPLN